MELLVVETVVISTHLFVEFVLAPRRVFPSHGLQKASKFFNALYSFASLVMLVWWIGLAPQIRLFCGQVEHSSLLRVYFYSKLWELIDLVMCSLRGIPINAHFRVHHYTTPVFAFLGLVTRSSSSFVFMGLNLFMHVMVYAFHAGFQPNVLKRMIRFWQNVQLLGGSALAGVALLMRYAGSPCSYSVFGDLIPPCLYMTYYVLFLKELRDAGE